MPRGQENSRDSLSCAACLCHRGFHHRELRHHCKNHHPEQSLHSSHPQLEVPLSSSISLLSSCHLHLHSRDAIGGAGDVESEPERNDQEEYWRLETPDRLVRGKRFWTKFMPEQKERMLEFAERIGWRMNRNDDVVLNQFCREVGVKRNVLEARMHNNKNAHHRRQLAVLARIAMVSPPPAATAQPLES